MEGEAVFSARVASLSCPAGDWVTLWRDTISARAQWLNYPNPGIPGLKDGRPNLSAPTPRTADGKPNLTGVWAHERTSIADFKRIFGSSYEAESQAALVGMELESVHKYLINILLDFKPGESPLRPKAEALMKQRVTERRVDNAR